MIRIVDASVYLPVIAQLSGRLSLANIDEQHRQWLRKINLTPIEQNVVIAPYINHGRWLFDCPICDAGGAVVIGLTRGWCFGCGGVFNSVMWPSEDDRKEIVKALEKRPNVKNVNWHPSESLQQLKDENTYHIDIVSEQRRVMRDQMKDEDFQKMLQEFEEASRRHIAEQGDPFKDGRKEIR